MVRMIVQIITYTHIIVRRRYLQFNLDNFKYNVGPAQGIGELSAQPRAVLSQGRRFLKR